MEGWKDLPEIILLEIYAHLSFSDRFSASSTCKRWREVLFHPNNWVQASFNFGQNDIQKETFLCTQVGHFISECTIKLCGVGIDPLSCYSQSSNAAEVIRLLESLSLNKRLQHLTFFHFPSDHESIQMVEDRVVFDSSKKISPDQRVTRSCARQLLDSGIDILYLYGRSCYQPCNSMSFWFNILELTHHHFGQQVRVSSRLLSRPNAPFCTPIDTFRWEAVISYLLLICMNANNLCHLSLGCSPKLTQRKNDVIRLLKQHQFRSMTSLHISQIKPTNSCPPVNLTDLLSLRNLQCISLDMRDVSDLMLVGLTEGGRAKLTSLSINLHKHSQGVRPIKDRTWKLVKESCPIMNLTLNIIRCPEALHDIMTVVTPNMPLSSLRVYFCDDVFVPGLHHLSRYQCDTLESIDIVESLLGGPIFYEIGANEQDPFVMMAWRCSKLTSFSVIGIALQELNVVAVARLRGRQLKKYDILDECITPPIEGEEVEFEEDFTMSYDSFCEEISSCLGREWQPLSAEDVDPCIYDMKHSECRVVLPSLLQDQRLSA